MLLLFTGCTLNKEKKFNECKEACEANSACVKYGEKESRYLEKTVTYCEEQSSVMCINNCIDKYK
jgi:hypothetical protein